MLDFIVNSRGFRGKNKNFLAELEAKLKELGEEFRIHLTEHANHAYELAKELTAKGIRTLIAVGGDGTVNEVLNGMACPEECTFGLVPFGTGNDFASSVKLPIGLEALDYIVGKIAKPVDYIQFEDGKRSLNISGFGIDVDVLERCERMKHFRAKTKYFFSLLSSLLCYHGDNIVVKRDGVEEKHKAMVAAICNGVQFGGGIPICPVASPTDGKLEVVVIDTPKWYKLPGMLIKLMGGKILQTKYANHFPCESVEICPESGTITAQYDGELMKTEGLKAHVVAGKMKMFIGE